MTLNELKQKYYPPEKKIEDYILRSFIAERSYKEDSPHIWRALNRAGIYTLDEFRDFDFENGKFRGLGPVRLRIVLDMQKELKEYD